MLKKREIKIQLARSGITSKQLSDLTGIPYQRVMKGINGYLIKGFMEEEEVTIKNTFKSLKEKNKEKK